MTEDELQALLERTLPAADLHGLFVEECQDQDVRLRFSPVVGGNWTSAALLSLVDTSLRAAAGVTANLTHLAVNFVVKPTPTMQWAHEINALVNGIGFAIPYS